jgi:outer membrane protein TolC
VKFAVLLLFPPALLAQQVLHLTLDGAVQLALRQNPAVASAQQELDAAEARIREARAGYFPQVGFNGIAKAGLSGATNALGLVGLPNSPFYQNFADSLDISQTGFDFGRTSHRVAFERRKHDAAAADLDTVKASVTVQTKRTFYQVFRAQRLENAAQEVVASRELMLRQARIFYEAQYRSRVDLDLAQAGLAQAQRDRLKAREDRTMAEADLDRVLGFTQSVPYSLETPDLTAPKLEALSSAIDLAYQSRPELRSLAAEVAAAHERVQAARSERRPLLRFAFSGSYARFTTLAADQLTAGGAGLLLPLFTGGRLAGQVEEAEAEFAALQNREASLKQQIRYEVRAAWLELQEALEALPLLQSGVTASRSAVRLASERYQERLGSAVELTVAQSNLAQALSAEYTGTIDVKIAEADLRFAEGKE